MERQLPRNVRQIGNVSDTPKIYVEDYVDTFFAQLCEKAQQKPVGAFLVGQTQTTDGEDYVFIHGAIQMHGLKAEGKDVEIDEETWKNGYEDCKQYFEDSGIVGWFMARPGGAPALDPGILKAHRKSFAKKNTILILKDSVEKEEAYYAYKFNDLMEIGGHYTYYEKNPSMQNYMISSRKRNGVSPSETIEDRVAKDFRSLIRSKEEQQEQKRAARMMYMASAVLILVVVIMGITTINNFDKMKTAATALENAAAPASAEQPEEAAAQMEDDTPEEDKPETEDDTVSRSDYFAEEAQAANAEVSAEENGQVGAAAVREDTAEAENGSNGVYVVEEGDTLAVISQKMYGDVGHVEAICKMNGLEEGDFIYIGQKLVLP